MKTNYSYQNWKPESMARAYGRDLPISMKQSAMICQFIKGKQVSKAKQMLMGVLEFKMAVPFSRFNWNMGHKPGIGPGRYPQKASDNILTIVESAEANAQSKGLDTGSLVVLHAVAHKASRPWRQGNSKAREKAKRSHIEIVVGVQAKQEKKEIKKQEKKGETKK